MLERLNFLLVLWGEYYIEQGHNLKLKKGNNAFTGKSGTCLHDQHTTFYSESSSKSMVDTVCWSFLFCFDFQSQQLISRKNLVIMEWHTVAGNAEHDLSSPETDGLCSHTPHTHHPHPPPTPLRYPPPPWENGELTDRTSMVREKLLKVSSAKRLTILLRIFSRHNENTHVFKKVAAPQLDM